MSFLLDTNVVSEVRKPNVNPGVRTWFDGVADADLYLSVLVLGEIRQGIERLRSRDQPQVAAYEAWLEMLQSRYADRILAVTPVVAEEWGRMNAVRSLPVIDGLMAATAKAAGLTFVTRNVDDLRGSGARLLNPFS